MFKQAIPGAAVPKYLSSDHDPLYLFHQWQANLRVLEVQEIKTVPYVPLLASVRGETNRNAAGTTWTKRYSEPQRIWSRNSAFSRIISIYSVCSEGRLPDPEEAPTPLKFIHIGGSNTVAPLPKRIGDDPEIRQ